MSISGDGAPAPHLAARRAEDLQHIDLRRTSTPWELLMRKHSVLPRGRIRGVSEVDMELNEASHGGVHELSVDYDINSAADYNFWPVQDE